MPLIFSVSYMFIVSTTLANLFGTSSNFIIIVGTKTYKGGWGEFACYQFFAPIELYQIKIKTFRPI